MHLICGLCFCLFYSCAENNTDSTPEQENNKQFIETKTAENIEFHEKPIDVAVPLEKLMAPINFQIDLYAKGLDNARSLALSPEGTLYVGSRWAGKVYAVIDEDKDNFAEKVVTIATGMYMPNGVAFRGSDLYIAEVNKVWKIENADKHLRDSLKKVPVTMPEKYSERIEEDKQILSTAEVVNDSLPWDAHHGWKYIAFGPDDKLYVPIGAPCNICEKLDNPFYSTITRMNPDGSNHEVYAHGVRNSVGFDWHPKTGEMWFTDNGRDWLGDDQPSDELNHAPEPGMHFGYPYCHQGDIKDPEFGHKKSCDAFTPPALNLGPHVAALGIEFYTGNMFPKEYKNRALIALHGSWNRSQPIGYRLVMATITEDQATDYQPFIVGWLKEDGEAWGRPVDILQMPDGALLVSDDRAGVIYRVYYEEEV